MRTTYVIGDVHGCNEELVDLLVEVYHDCGGDPCDIVFAGDMIDKGSDSHSVVLQIQTMMKTQDEFTGVFGILGNHEDKFLRWLGHEYRRSHFPDYKNPILKKTEWNIPLVRWAKEEGGAAWLKSLPLHYKIPDSDYVVVHGGVPPVIDQLAGDWDSASRFAKTILFTRFVNPGGNMVALGKETEEDKWWAEAYDGRFGTVIYGHQPSRDVVFHEHAIGIDTGCCFGGKLTALKLPSRELIQVKASKAYATPYSDESFL